MFLILLKLESHGGAMDPSILGDDLALPATTCHQHCLASVTESSVLSRFEDLVQLRLFHGRQSDPSHLYHLPLIQNCTRGYLKKDARSSAACISAGATSIVDTGGS